MQKPTILQLRASPFFGGPERQMLELACESRDLFRWVFVSFQEEGRYHDFLDHVEGEGFETHVLQHDWPRLLATYRELLALVKQVKADVLCCHGYKSNLLSLMLRRRLGIPAVSVSHGWTSESLAVRVFEALDRHLLRYMDAVVCVSEGQAEKVRQAGVPDWKVQVIHNAIRLERFGQADPAYRQLLESMFADRPSMIIGAAGRLSPEKAFHDLVDAAAQLCGPCAPCPADSHLSPNGRADAGNSPLATPHVPRPTRDSRCQEEEGASSTAHSPPPPAHTLGFVLFGDGPRRAALEAQIKARGLAGRFCIAGFRSDLDKFLPHLDLFVQSSLTEGLPNVLLEAFGTGVPVVATDVGGTAELVDDGVNGYLVPPGDSVALAAKILEMLMNPDRQAMGSRGQERMKEHFTFLAQARAYRQLYARFVPLLPARGRRQGPTILHLTASPSFGGPERQMLELGCKLRGDCRSVYASFKEEGRCGPFIRSARQEGFAAYAMKHDTPRLLACYREVLSLARTVKPAVLCPHGYKSNLIGLLVARRLGIPIVSVSHGWTAESLWVRLYEALDRRVLRHMDKVVCVSEGQAKKVRRAGVPTGKVEVIRDAVRSERFAEVDASYRDRLERMFPVRPEVIVGAAGRLSPEKGFKHLVDAAAQVLQSSLAAPNAPRPTPDSRCQKEEVTSSTAHSPPPTTHSPLPTAHSVGFVLFGDGPLRDALTRQIAACGLEDDFILAGFHSDLDKFYPHLDLLVLPSYTEGLPNVVLEAFAAGVPVVATAVGGTPEAVEEGVNGYLVPPGDATALARRIGDMLSDPVGRRAMGLRGQERVRKEFSFARQGQEYLQLFESVVLACAASDRLGPRLPEAAGRVKEEVS